MQEYDDCDDPDWAPELIRPEDFLAPNPFPLDAQRMGFDRFTGDSGALIALAAALDGSKLSHRIVAWLLLVVVVGSFVLTLWYQLS
jgi:hypothetical protein